MADGKLSYEVEFKSKGLDQVQAEAATMKASLGGGEEAGAGGNDPIAQLRAQAAAIKDQIVNVRASTQELNAMKTAATGANAALLFSGVAGAVLLVTSYLENASDEVALFALELEKMGRTRERIFDDFMEGLPRLEFKEDYTSALKDTIRKREDLVAEMDALQVKLSPATTVGGILSQGQAAGQSFVRGLFTGDFSIQSNDAMRMKELKKQLADYDLMIEEQRTRQQGLGPDPQGEARIASAEQAYQDNKIIRNADQDPAAAMELVVRRFDEASDKADELKEKYYQLSAEGAAGAKDMEAAYREALAEMERWETLADRLEKGKEKKKENIGRISLPTAATYDLREIGGTVGDPGRAGIGRDDPKYFQEQSLQVLRNIEQAIKQNRERNYPGMTSQGWED